MCVRIYTKQALKITSHCCTFYVLVDNTGDHTLISFMDSVSGYDKIQMAPKDKEKLHVSLLGELSATKSCHLD